MLTVQVDKHRRHEHELSQQQRWRQRKAVSCSLLSVLRMFLLVHAPLLSARTQKYSKKHNEASQNTQQPLFSRRCRTNRPTDPVLCSMETTAILPLLRLLSPPETLNPYILRRSKQNL
ncbi:hypothetical protein E2C01_065055 [Portunus trituberculatus]|uniref:Uncharacterized protein n=1 Tax=Portunus trituberculatus TaxID=210409 RepID=A0A5B7HLI2_PORTR|nr:hypothetical protein [Portunus trituberculatus]